jgi:hypothetical protein
LGLSGWLAGWLVANLTGWCGALQDYLSVLLMVAGLICFVLGDAVVV